MSTQDKKATPPPQQTLEPLGNSAVAELLKAGRSLANIQTIPGLAPVAILPHGFEVVPIPPKKLAELPDHIRQEVRLDDAESFIDYVKNFGTSTLRIFASQPDLSRVAQGGSGGAQFTAFMDYHEGGKDGKAKRAKHVAKYPVPLSLEFRTWLQFNGKGLKQMDFVQFIEANCADVVNPSAGAIMDMILGFEQKSSVEFQSKIDRTTGGRELKYIEKVEEGNKAAGSMTVPEGLELRLPVFEGGKPFEFRARMEYRARDGALYVTYHLQRPHDVFRQAWKELREEIATATNQIILTGEASNMEPDDEDPAYHVN